MREASQVLCPFREGISSSGVAKVGPGRACALPTVPAALPTWRQIKGVEHIVLLLV